MPCQNNFVDWCCISSLNIPTYTIMSHKMKIKISTTTFLSTKCTLLHQNTKWWFCWQNFNHFCKQTGDLLEIGWRLAPVFLVRMRLRNAPKWLEICWRFTCTSTGVLLIICFIWWKSLSSFWLEICFSKNYRRCFVIALFLLLKSLLAGDFLELSFDKLRIDWLEICFSKERSTMLCYCFVFASQILVGWRFSGVELW